MTSLRAIAAILGISLFEAAQPAAAQAVSPNAAWSCTFASSPVDCGFSLQAAAPDRASLVTQARDGTNAVQLTTQPGDSELSGSGTAERADLVLSPSGDYCNAGQEEWWAHSLMFPSDYVAPTGDGNWGVVFDFHHTGQTGQANFQIFSTPTGLEFGIAGGPTVIDSVSDPAFNVVSIGSVTTGMWYDFIYHVKWSSGSDGFFQAWLNGQQVMNFNGPTLYAGQSCYLKVANYHTPTGAAVSIVHSRIVRGTGQADVQIASAPQPPANPPPPSNSPPPTPSSPPSATNSPPSSGAASGGGGGGGGALDVLTLLSLVLVGLLRALAPAARSQMQMAWRRAHPLRGRKRKNAT